MKISVQCYTLRNEFEKDVEGTFKKLKEIGLNYVELAGLYGHPPAQIKAILDANGLKASGTHVGLDRFQNDFNGLVKECQTLGIKDVILPWIGEDSYKDGWEKFAQSLTPVVEKCEKAGLRFAYHNHAFEFKFQGDQPGMDVFYQAADPSVHAQLDLYWCYTGGQDPAAYVRKLKGRIVSVHLKDGKGEDKPQYSPAEGVLKWDEILAACESSGVEVGAIEYDECVGSPFDAVAASLDFFRKKGYAE